MKLSTLKTFTSAVALSSALTLGQMGSALAEDGNTQQQQAQPVSTQQVGELTIPQKLDMANDYSLQNGGQVGIFINVAPDTKYTPIQIGESMVKKFADEGINAAYVHNYAKQGKSSVTFYMNGYVWAGYSLGASPQAFSEVVKTYRAMKALEVSGSPTTPDNLALNH